MTALFHIFGSLAFGFLFFNLQLKSISKPNVLFLAVDDMNDWIGCLGKTPRAITPNTVSYTHLTLPTICSV